MVNHDKEMRMALQTQIAVYICPYIEANAP